MSAFGHIGHLEGGWAFHILGIHGVCATGACVGYCLDFSGVYAGGVSACDGVVAVGGIGGRVDCEDSVLGYCGSRRRRVEHDGGGWAYFYGEDAVFGGAAGG